MSKVGSMTNAVNTVLSTFSASKGGYGGMALKGAAIGGGIGAAYGGISDNHTALGMGLAGATLGFGGGREYAGLKAWQGHINSKISAVNAKRGADATKRNLLSGGDNAWKYAKNRFNSMGG